MEGILKHKSKRYCFLVSRLDSRESALNVITPKTTPIACKIAAVAPKLSECVMRKW
uniref:Uncharacterized protein n=1 Tax=Arundo donax TaxID=35708 RepID=A0A0A9GZA4_ARUDO